MNVSTPGVSPPGDAAAPYPPAPQPYGGSPGPYGAPALSGSPAPYDAPGPYVAPGAYGPPGTATPGMSPSPFTSPAPFPDGARAGFGDHTFGAPPPYAAPPVRRRGWTGGKVAALAVATGGAGLVAGLLLGSRPDEPAAPSEPWAEREPPPSAVDPVADADGTPERPFPLDTRVRTDEWEVTLGEPYEAWAEIEAEGGHTPPPDGMEYWIVPVTATYTGSTSGFPGMDLVVGFAEPDGDPYQDACGYNLLPDDLILVEALQPGETATGNTCVTVPVGADGSWTLATFNGGTAYFAAGG